MQVVAALDEIADSPLADKIAAANQQALDRLGMKPEMRETEAAPEQVGAPLPALAIDGEIVVSGVVTRYFTPQQ